MDLEGKFCGALGGNDNEESFARGHNNNMLSSSTAASLHTWYGFLRQQEVMYVPAGGSNNTCECKQEVNVSCIQFLLDTTRAWPRDICKLLHNIS